MSANPIANAKARRSLLSRRSVLWLALLVWTGFALTYIVRTQWQHFRDEAIAKIGQDTLREARVSARREAIEQLLTLVEQCKPIDVSTETKSDQVVSVKCLQGQSDPQAQTEGRPQTQVQGPVATPTPPSVP